ncbi:MAG: diacylglycerol kinase family lipid kinase [Kiritimatiellia bacterium]|nr:diacylglycerol kinase family lipid kinase [Kiritimatiellia bacterium]
MPRLAMIVNPHSGLQQGPQILDVVMPFLANAGLTLDVRETSHPEHAGEMAELMNVEGLDGICAIGGDGTFHEVLNGVMRRKDGKRLPLGLIPGGLGNSLMHDLQTIDPLKAAKRITRLDPQPMDLMKVECPDMTCYAFNLAAFGLMVGANIKAERLRVFGRRRYDVAALWEIIFNRHHKAMLTVDNGKPEEDDYAFITGMNTVHMGLGMKIAPRAKIDDGKLDLILVRRVRRHQLIGMLSKVYSGEHVSSPQLEYRQVTSFKITTSAPAPLNIDGEIKGTTTLTVTIEPQAVQLL